ncbi:MAG: LysR substrate-binding domain-containing protein, partial [Onishia taeanensis]|uniref:LysR substrate-binding domain-containing protein n=1 Tax=Onishia taeanensis TaxID=284577 RepID=UPI003C7A39ED
AAARLEAPKDLAGETLLHAAGFAVGWPAWLERAGIAGIEGNCPTIICDTQMMTLTLAAAGGGVALTHRRLVESRADLVQPFSLSVESVERFWLVRPANRQPREAAEALWAWLSDGLGEGSAGEPP